MALKLNQGEGSRTVETSYKRFAPPSVERRFNKYFISRKVWEEQGFQSSAEPDFGIDHYLFNKVAHHKWHIFCIQPARANVAIMHEFYAYNPSAGSIFVHIRGKVIKVDADAINQFYGLHTARGLHAEFLVQLTEEDYERVKDKLCYAGTAWEVGAHKGSVQQQKLRLEPKLWNTFVKRRLLPTSHNNTADRPRGREDRKAGSRRSCTEAVPFAAKDVAAAECRRQGHCRRRIPPSKTPPPQNAAAKDAIAAKCHPDGNTPT